MNQSPFGAPLSTVPAFAPGLIWRMRRRRLAREFAQRFAHAMAQAMRGVVLINPADRQLLTDVLRSYGIRCADNPPPAPATPRIDPALLPPKERLRFYQMWMPPLLEIRYSPYVPRYHALAVPEKRFESPDRGDSLALAFSLKEDISVTRFDHHWSLLRRPFFFSTLW